MDPRISRQQRPLRRSYRTASGRSAQYIPRVDPNPRYVTPPRLLSPQQRQQPPLHTNLKRQDSAQYSTHAAPSHASTTASSSDCQLLFISKDFVPDRQMWSKWILALLCIVQSVSAWTCVGYHIVNYSEESRLEIGVSVGILVGGNIFMTGIANLALFVHRWRHSSPRTRAKISEENHEAMICTRVALTILGFAPLARYLEQWMIIRRLTDLEHGYLDGAGDDTHALSKANLNVAGSKLSYPSRVESNRIESESILSQPVGLLPRLQKLRRVRRQFVYCDFDAAVVTLASATLGAGPFAISQGVLFMRRLMKENPMTQGTSVAILTSFIFSVLWLASAACQFLPDMHYLTDNDMQLNRYKISVCGRVLLFFARLIHISIRLIAFVFFIALFKSIVIAVLGLHGAIYFISLIIFRCTATVLKAGYRPNPNFPSPLDERIKTKGVLSHLVGDLAFTYASIFEFFNAGAGKTRLRVIVYYFAYYLENAGMIGAWYQDFRLKASWFYLPVLLVVVTVQWGGAIFLQLYFFYFSASPRGTALCGLCCPDEMRSVSSPAKFRAAVLDSAIPLYLPRRDSLPTGYDPLSGQPTVQHAVPVAPITDHLSHISVPLNSSLYSRHQPAQRPVQQSLGHISAYSRQALGSSPLLARSQPDLEVRNQSGVVLGRRQRISVIESQFSDSLTAITTMPESSSRFPRAQRGLVSRSLYVHEPSTEFTGSVSRPTRRPREHQQQHFVSGYDFEPYSDDNLRGWESEGV